MKLKKKELGKGIRALLNDMDTVSDAPTLENVKELTSGIALIKISEITPNPDQPRNQFDDAQLEELAQSIKTFGIIQPLTLRSLGHDQFQIIAGERRYRAAQLAGLKEVPAYVRLANDQELLEMALVENIQREDLNAIEIAVSYRRLMDECQLTQDALSDRIGKDRSTIANYVRLLKLLPDIQAAVKNKEISMGHARALAGIDDIALQLAFFKQASANGWSVRLLENNIRDHYAKKSGTPSKAKVTQDPAIESITDKLKKQYGLKVRIDRNAKGAGSVKFYFNSDNELNQILDVIDQ